MTTEPDSRTRTVLSWLREDAHENAERMLLRALDEVDATPQRRPCWPARRSSEMNTFAKALVAAAAVVAIAVVGINLLPGIQRGAGGATPSASPSAPSTVPSASPSPTTKPTPSLVAHTIRACCTEDNAPVASMTFTVTAPPSWDAWNDGGVDLGVTANWSNAAEGDEAFVGLYPGGNLFSEPCLTDENAPADIRVGPTVDDLVTALVDHPKLDVTAPVDVTLAGYSGKYLDLTTPDDISKCARYFPMDHHIYAQGPGQRWHMWILDVDGVRVLVETNDYPDTPPGVLAEEPAIVNSLVITP
jgi:hypothetical protein